MLFPWCDFRRTCSEDIYGFGCLIFLCDDMIPVSYIDVTFMSWKYTHIPIDRCIGEYWWIDVCRPFCLLHVQGLHVVLDINPSHTIDHALDSCSRQKNLRSVGQSIYGFIPLAPTICWVTYIPKAFLSPWYNWETNSSPSIASPLWSCPSGRRRNPYFCCYEMA